MTELDLSGHKILIVDDVAFARHTLKTIVSGFGMPDIVEANNGLEALFTLRSEVEFSFAILDYKMPQMNGLEVLRAIRLGDAGVPRTFPVAILTGHSERGLVDDALKLDVNGFIVKPVSKDSLAKRLSKLLEIREDVSWIKPTEHYHKVPEREEPTADRPSKLEPSRRPVATFIGKPSPTGTRVPLQKGKFTDRDLASSSPKPKKSTQKPGGMKLFGSDLAAAVQSRLSKAVADGNTEAKKAQEHTASALEEQSPKEVMDVAADLYKKGVFDASDLNAIASTPIRPQSSGKGTAALESKAAEGSTDDAWFVALNEIPEGAILAEHLRTPDGSRLVTAGTLLTEQVIAALRELAQGGLVELEKPPGDIGPETPGLLVRMSEVPVDLEMEAEKLPVEQIPTWSVLARDIRMNDGRLFMKQGTLMTGRNIALLKDLWDLECVQMDVWIHRA